MVCEGGAEAGVAAFSAALPAVRSGKGAGLIAELGVLFAPCNEVKQSSPLRAGQTDHAAAEEGGVAWWFMGYHTPWGHLEGRTGGVREG